MIEMVMKKKESTNCSCGLLPMKNKRIDELEVALFGANALIDEVATLLDDSEYPVTEKEINQIRRMIKDKNG